MATYCETLVKTFDIGQGEAVRVKDEYDRVFELSRDNDGITVTYLGGNDRYTGGPFRFPGNSDPVILITQLTDRETVFYYIVFGGVRLA